MRHHTTPTQSFIFKNIKVMKKRIKEEEEKDKQINYVIEWRTKWLLILF